MVPKREIKMGEIEENWQPAKFYCSEIKLIYSNTLPSKRNATLGSAALMTLVQQPFAPMGSLTQN